jgi:predicted transposase YbfD/YdcC
VDLLFKEHEQNPELFKFDIFRSACTISGSKIENRTVTVIYMTSPAAREWFPMHIKWENIQIVVKCVRYALYTKKGKASSQEQRYFIISDSFDASHVNDIIIEHWKVETTHQILDVTYQEDKCKVSAGRAPELFSLFRKLSLNLIAPLMKRFKVSAGQVLFHMRSNWKIMMDILKKHPKDILPFKEWADSTSQLT